MNEENLLSSPGDKDSCRNLGQSLTPRCRRRPAPSHSAQRLSRPPSAARNLPGRRKDAPEKNKSPSVNTPFRPVRTNRERACLLVRRRSDERHSLTRVSDLIRGVRGGDTFLFEYLHLVSRKQWKKTAQGLYFLRLAVSCPLTL